MQLIYSRSIDKSMLWDGFSIQSCLLDIVTGITGKLEIGENRDIKFMLNGKIYNGIKLKNQPFNREKYPTHKEMYQIRYNPSSEFSKALRILYSDVWEYVSNEIDLQRIAIQNGERRRIIRIPEDLNRKIAFYTTENPDVWMVETFSQWDNLALKDSLKEANEINYEQTDDHAGLTESVKKVKLRILDRNIGNNLKKLYQFRCQVCGQTIGEPYGNSSIVDAHHIDPFILSQNNNFDNIMILCPNHHRIIHQCHGEFHKNIKQIWYPNGLHESLSLNLHL